MKPKMLTTREAAERLGVTVGRVRQMVIKGQLPSEKFGRDLMIAETDLMLVAERKPGRPRKDAEAKESLSEPSAQPHLPVPSKPKKLTTAQKESIREAQEKRWQAAVPGKKVRATKPKPSAPPRPKRTAFLTEEEKRRRQFRLEWERDRQSRSLGKKTAE